MLTNRYIIKPLLLLSLGSQCIGSLYAAEYSLRKYLHVKAFYASITPLAIQVSQKHQLPAASILAIAGLESGYGSGYVSEITGNIMSLGVFKGDKELPALYLPYSITLQKILFDPKEIYKRPKKDLLYKRRAKSFKRDYRPIPYAGTKNHLALLKHNQSLRTKAHLACFNDFATRWITLQSNIKVFRDTRLWLNQKILEKDDKILDSMSINIAFINKIGGVARSFNYRKAWPKKVNYIMQKAGLVALVNDIKYNKMSFNEAWESNK